MCGIVGYVGKRSAQDVLLDGLEKLEYRGYDSAGVALALDGGIRVVKSKGRLTQLRQKLAAQALAQSFCGIGHTRWATHGEPSDVNSHPHSTPRVSIVHNGIIENYGILKERLMAKGYTFESETDTEVLVKLIDSCYTGDPLRALQEALAKVRGSYALAVLFRDRPDTIFAVKRESPLIVGWGEGENFVASDIPALLKYTRRYSVLEEGDMAVCTAEGIRFYNEFAEPVQRPVLTADWDMEAAEKSGYPHFMLKEINEQPTAITATVSPRVEDGMPDLRIPQLTDEVLRSIGTVHLVGCGTAMHAGMVGKAAIETLARVPAEVDIASEFRYRDPILNPNDLVIIISQSGETVDTLAALLAGFAILPAVFAFGIDPTSGPQLMFVTLPQIFQQMPGGRIFALLFFVSVFFAGITSLMNMLEACGEALTSTFRLSRTVSTLLVGAAAFLPGLFLESLAGMGSWMDLITIYVSPFGALLVAVCIYFVLGMKGIRAELALGRARAPGRLFGITARFYVFLTVAVWILGIAYGGIG